MGGFAPSSQFTAYQVISQATSMSKTVDQNAVLEAQRKNFYRTALVEIVTLLNGAVDRSYLTNIEAVHIHEDDTYTPTPKQILVQDDPIMGNVSFMSAINMLQKRVVDSIIYDPLKYKQIDRIISIEQRVEGMGTPYIAVQPFSGQIKPVKLTEMQSIMKLDFAHGAYKDDIVYLEIGGDPVKAESGAWTDRDENCQHLPESGGGDEAIFNSYWVRLRKDRNNGRIPMKPVYTDSSNFYRIFYTIWFNRLPNFPLEPNEGSTIDNDGWRPDSRHPSRFIDLPDKYMPLLVKRIYTYCLLQLNQAIPDSLSADIMNDYRQIYAMMDSETRSLYQPKLEQISSQLGR